MLDELAGERGAVQVAALMAEHGMTCEAVIEVIESYHREKGKQITTPSIRAFVANALWRIS